MPNTLYDKIWNEHLVHQQEDGTALLFVDRHLVHEVTSPQAFEGLRNSKRKVRHPKLTLAVADHNVPTTDRSKGISDQESKIQVETLEANCKQFGIKLFGMGDKRQGIVHVTGPEQGFTQPGTVIVCGDSHTATHGAFGALAFGIGTSEVEHVLATQTLVQKKAKNFRINVNGTLPLGVTSKDVILQIIGKIGTAGGTGYVIEYAGDLIKSLTVENRMTICNMTIEGGARAGLIAPDEKIFKYLEGRPMTPKGKDWDKALENWKNLNTDYGARFDKEINLTAGEISPMITWGTSPQDVITIDGKVPNPSAEKDEDKKNSLERALKYMGLKPDMAAKDIKIDKVFIGSCTNGRIEDLREAAKILKDKKIASHVHAMVVPGSGLVKEQAEQEGLDKIFAASLKSSILPFVQLPIKTLSIFISLAAISGLRPIYFKALSIEFFLSSSCSVFGFGTLPSIVITSWGEVPQVIIGKISLASKLISLSKVALSSDFKFFQYSRAFSHFSPFGDIGFPSKYLKIFSSGAINPARAPPSMVMLHIVILCSTLNDLIKSPAYSTTHPVPPAVPIFPIICKITSFEVTPNGSFPFTFILKFFAFF